MPKSSLRTSRSAPPKSSKKKSSVKIKPSRSSGKPHSYAASFVDENVEDEKTFVVLDIVNSTAMKQADTKAKWVNTYRRIFKAFEDALPSFESGQLVKYTGDGVFLAFDSAAEAINYAIEVQENLFLQNKNRDIDAQCSCGISTGSSFPIKKNVESIDYLGVAIDRAFRLCGSANAYAIVVDRTTQESCAVNAIKSKRGLANDRTPAEYWGEAYSADLKGVPEPVPYYEILWHEKRFEQRNKSIEPSAEAPARDPEYVRAIVTNVQATKGFVFAQDESKRDHYIAQGSFVENALPKLGDVVYLVPGQAARPGIPAPASHVLIVGQDYSWRVVNKPEGKDFLFVKLEWTSGAPNVFAFVGLKAEHYGLDKVFKWDLQENLKRKSPVLQLGG